MSKQKTPHVEYPVRVTTKQEKFCFYYMKEKSARKAALLAGYSQYSAASASYAILRKPSVQARLKQLQEEAEANQPGHVSEAMVIENIKADRRGAITKGQYGAAMRANELLGKQIGMFEDKVQISHKSLEDYLKELEAKPEKVNKDIQKPAEQPSEYKVNNETGIANA